MLEPYDMTGSKYLFQELDETQWIKVQLGNIREMQVKENAQTSHGKLKRLESVQFMLDLGYNLLRVRKLMTREHSVL